MKSKKKEEETPVLEKTGLITKMGHTSTISCKDHIIPINF